MNHKPPGGLVVNLATQGYRPPKREQHGACRNDPTHGPSHIRGLCRQCYSKLAWQERKAGLGVVGQAPIDPHPTVCPRCGNGVLSRNGDRDVECFRCGTVIYRQAPMRLVPNSTQHNSGIG